MHKAYLFSRRRILLKYRLRGLVIPGREGGREGSDPSVVSGGQVDARLRQEERYDSRMLVLYGDVERRLALCVL